MILISCDFCHNRKNYNFDPYNVLLAIATNIPVLLMTASVLQGHIHTISYCIVNSARMWLCSGTIISITYYSHNSLVFDVSLLILFSLPQSRASGGGRASAGAAYP